MKRQIVLHITLIISILYLVATTVAQEPTLREAPSGISQTVLINHSGTIKAFRRERLDKTWGEWIEWAPRRSDEKSKIFKPRAVNQAATTKLIGKDVLRWLSKRPPVSGHYNFSGNKNYDWKRFAGDRFGTWMQPTPTKYGYAVRKIK